MKIKPCYNCDSNDLKHIKSFSSYHMIKCENCVIKDRGYFVHPLEGANSYEKAIENWNKKYMDKKLKYLYQFNFDVSKEMKEWYIAEAAKRGTIYKLVPVAEVLREALQWYIEHMDKTNSGLHV